MVMGGEGGDCTVCFRMKLNVRFWRKRLCCSPWCLDISVRWVVLERAFLPGLTPGSFPSHAWTLFSLFLFLSFSLLPLPHPPGHGLPGEPVRRSGAGYKAPSAGHAEFPAEKPRTRPGPATWHGL